MGSAQNKRALAADVWRMIVNFAWARRGPFFATLRDLGLTPSHGKALLALDPDDAHPMGSLADTLSCDASTVTWMVDGLEERGLVERRTLPTDRRVKTLVLTPLGVKTKARILDDLYEPPDEFVTLDRATLQSLRDALSSLPNVERARIGDPREIATPRSRTR